MKKLKKISSILLALVMIISLLPLEASAATKDVIPTKARLFSGWDDSAIEIELTDENQTIGNIKSSSKNLRVMLTGSDYRFDEQSPTENKNEYTIGLHSKKDGTYTVSFDILDKDKKKVATKDVKVYVYPTPEKSITINGKKLKNSELSGKSGKVNVSLTSGNKINKLEYGVYKHIEKDKSVTSEMVYKSFKNNSKVTFGNKPHYYSSDHSYESEYTSYISRYFNTGMSCPTYIRITYYDKYTKQNETFTKYFQKVIE